MRQFRKWEVEVAPRSNAKIGGAPSAEETGYRAMNNVERRTVLGWNSLNDVPRRVERKLKVHCGVAVTLVGYSKGADPSGAAIDRGTTTSQRATFSLA